MNLKRLTSALGLSALFVAFIIAALVGTAPHAIVQARPNDTLVGGVITQSVTWDAAGSPYVMNTSVIVTYGVTLTIEPGVIVQGTSHLVELRVLGTLSAIGTAAQPITVTTNDTGLGYNWLGLVVDGGTAQLRHTTVEYACGDIPAGGSSYTSNILVINNGYLDMADSTVQHCDYGGGTAEMMVRIIDARANIHATTFSDSQWYPLEVAGANSVITLTDNVITGNHGYDRIRIEADALMATDATLYPQAVWQGYEFAPDFNVPATRVLTLQPGVIVANGGNAELRVYGQLKAIGMATQPITLTAANESDSNGWPGLLFDGAFATGDLRHVTVRYAQSSYGSTTGWRDALAVRNVVTGEVRIESSRVISTSAGDATPNVGIYVENSHVLISDTVLSGIGVNANGYPLRVKGLSSIITLTNNTFTDNLNDRILLEADALLGQDTTLVPQTGLQGYEFVAGFNVPATRTLTLAPGVIMQGPQNGELRVYGRLNAIGTLTQPITFTALASNNPGGWAGLLFDGAFAAGDLRYITVEHAGSSYGNVIADKCDAIDVRDVLTHELRLEDSRIQDFGGWCDNNGVYVENGHVTIHRTQFSNVGVRNDNAVQVSGDSVVLIAESTFGSNAGRALRVDGASMVTLTRNMIRNNNNGIYVGGDNLGVWDNNVLMDNQGTALYVAAGARVDLRHTTFARNGGEAVHVDNGGTAVLTNTIIANHSTGVNAVSGGSVTLTQTLWDNTTTPTIGAVSATGSLTGAVSFAPDGYHLTRYSSAIEQGIAANVADDIDGKPRPMPTGTAPDLGAVEYQNSPSQEFVAEKAALSPQWLPPDPLTGNLYGQLLQRYLIRFYYGSPDPNPSDLTVKVTDTLPLELGFESETHTPEMHVQQQSNRITWQTQSPIHKGQSGEIGLTTIYSNPQAGHVFTNQAELSAGAFQFGLQVTSSVPLVAPLITSPGNGEICSGTVKIRGVAQPGVTVTLYVNGSSYVGLQPDASGLFTTTYLYAGSSNVTIKAEACLNNDQCSADSDVITLTAPQSFWCPQRSSWEGTPTTGPLTGQHLTYQFRDNTGNFSTQNWIIPGVYGFWNTTLHLRACNCLDGSQPSSVWVIADGTRYDPAGSYPQYDFAITGGAHNVVFWAQCGTTQVSSQGHILIDPDGYVFDVTQGFAVPTNTVQGITVTAYVSMPHWGGWVPWPAQLYNNQVNPQITGSDGYFAFFTPPGSYYLQVEGANGYQAWRSPVIEVITQVVHMNVPLTRWLAGSFPQVTLTSDGLSPAVITVPVGSAVQWVSELNNLTPPAELVSLIENPVLRLLSARNPLSDTLGFDGGMMMPGQAYRRQFTRPGTYTYSDGVGHTAQVVVTNYRTYLPLVLKNH